MPDKPKPAVSVLRAHLKALKRLRTKQRKEVPLADERILPLMFDE